MDELEADAILEVAPGADLAEVKGAFRKLSKRYHPDKHTEDNQDWASKNFRRIKEAYEWLVPVLEDRAAQLERSRVEQLRTLALGEDATLQESVLLELGSAFCLDVGAWGKEPPFYSRMSLKLSGPLRRLEIGVYKSGDFENVRFLAAARPLGRLELADPPPSVTILTKVDAQGRVKISLLGEHRFLDFAWHPP
jgi:DnaJ-like protein